MKKSLWRFPLFILLSLVLACSGSPEKADGSLTEDSGPIPRYLELIPASTPYVFGALDPVPEPVALQQFAALDRALSASIEGLPDDAELSYMQPEERFATEMARELSGKLNERGLAELGLSSSPRFVAYGIGPFPVFRMEIDDGTKLMAMIDRVAAKSGLQLAVQKDQDVEYRSYVNGDAQIAFAVIGNEVVLTATEVDAGSIVIPYALGTKKPEKSMAQDNQLEQVVEAYGLQRHGVGFINVVETAAMFAQSGSALNAAAFSVLEEPEAEPVSAACQQELAEYAAAMPRVVFGLEELTVDTLTIKTAAEFTNDIPKRLKAAKRAIPGWAGQPIDLNSGAPVSVGVGAHVGGLLELAREKLRATRDRAFACEDFQDLPQSSSELLAATQFIPPVVSDLSGLRVGFEGVREAQADSASQPMAATRYLDAWAILRTPDPQSLFGTIRTFAPPEIQSLQVKPDGEPVEIPLNDATAPFESLKMVMTSDSIGLTTTDSLLTTTQKMAAAATDADKEGPMIAVAFDIAKVMTGVMGPMAPQQEGDTQPFFITVDPTDDAVVSTVRIPLKSLMSGSLF